LHKLIIIDLQIAVHPAAQFFIAIFLLFLSRAFAQFCSHAGDQRESSSRLKRFGNSAIHKKFHQNREREKRWK
jgi:hypothetical protein